MYNTASQQRESNKPEILNLGVSRTLAMCLKLKPLYCWGYTAGQQLHGCRVQHQMQEKYPVKH